MRGIAAFRLICNFFKVNFYVPAELCDLQQCRLIDMCVHKYEKKFCFGVFLRWMIDT